MNAAKSVRVNDLPAAWRETATLMRAHGHEPTARTLERCADELEDALAAEGDEVLTLAQAASESGYSERRLRELLKAGEVPQAGRRGAPRIRRADLPRKPATGGTFDAAAAARRLVAS